MEFNYWKRRQEFEKEQAVQRELYRKAGMSEAAIDEMYRFDLEVFRSERVYCRHTKQMKGFSISDEAGDDDTGKATGSKLRLQETLSVGMPLTDPERRDGWIDELDDEQLVRAILKLKPDDVELITLYAIEGYSVGEIADKQGVSHPTISKKLSRIKKNLNFFPNEATN